MEEKQTSSGKWEVESGKAEEPKGYVIRRVDEYHKFDCDFFGKLVVVEYQEAMERDPRWGIWNSGVSFTYSIKALDLVIERYGEPENVLLSIPELVCRIS